MDTTSIGNPIFRLMRNISQQDETQSNQIQSQININSMKQSEEKNQMPEGMNPNMQTMQMNYQNINNPIITQDMNFINKINPNNIMNPNIDFLPFQFTCAPHTKEKQMMKEMERILNQGNNQSQIQHNPFNIGRAPGFKNIFFRKNGGNEPPLMIQCMDNEKISKVIKRYRTKANDDNNSIKFIYNAK